MKKMFIIVIVTAVLLAGTTAFAAEYQGRGNNSSQAGRFFQEHQEQRLQEDCDATCEDCEAPEFYFYGQDRDNEEFGFGINRSEEDCDYEPDEDGEDYRYGCVRSSRS